jgi:hypothetical protein
VVKSLLLLIFLLSSAHAQVPVENPRPQAWPNNLWRRILTAADNVSYSLTQVLFDQIDRFDQDVFSTNYVKGEVRIRRDVYNNHDVLNSYSVVDYTKLNLKSNNLNYQFSGTRFKFISRPVFKYWNWFRFC